MASKAIAHTRPDPTTLVVTVEHGIADSFTRSVDPAAFRYARTVIRGGESWECTDAAYAVSRRHTARGREVCTSRLVFTRR